MRFIIFFISLLASLMLVQLNAQSLHGNYTIGGNSPDYLTWQEAVDSLKSKGIDGPVVFEVSSGTYEEQVNIPFITGSSEINTITFQSESGDSSEVILTYNANPSSPYTLQLNGAKHLIFQNLTIEGKNSNHARTLVITNGAKHLQFNHNQFKGITGNTSSNLALVYSPDGGYVDDSIHFNHNYFYQGSFGIYFQSPSSGEKDIVIQNNIFENQYYQAIYLYRQRAPRLSDNYISTNSSRNDFYGIQLNQIRDDFKITHNYINTNGGYGISISSSNSSVGKEGLVANNFIIIGGNSTAVGLYVYYSSHQFLYHNSVNVTSSYSSGSAIYFYYSNSVYSLNNNLVNSGSGYAVTDYSSTYHSNYNNLYTEGNRFAYKSNVINNFSAWKLASSQDSNSVSVDPVFTSETDLHANEAALYKKGIDTLGIENDFDHQVRDITQPSIGADEFTLPDNDAGIVQISSPNLPFKLGEQKIIVALRNFGSGNLTSASVNWSINDEEPTVYTWTGNLSPSDTDYVEIGTYDFQAGENYTISVTTSQPNGTVDANLENDQTQLRNLYSGLSGTYTIGGSAPDFENFTTAIQALSEGGVVDEVIFNIRPGTYEEQLILPDVPGNSCETSIVFQSENGDKNSVVVTHSNNSSSNYICLLDGISGVTFRNMTFEATHQSYGTVFYFDRGTSCNTFENNIIKNQSNGTSANQALVNSSSSNDHNTTWLGNNFENGSYGLYLYGDNTRESGNRIEGNTFTNQSYRGIYLYNQSSPVIEKNTLTAQGNRSDYIGVYLYYCYDSLKVSTNRIYSAAGGNGIYEYVCYGDQNKYGIIANNFIALGGTSNPSGIITSSSSYQKIYNNTVNIYSGNTDSRGYSNSSGSSIIIRNNIFSNSAGGYAIYSNNRNIDSDYNNLYSSGNYLGYYSSVKSSLSDWQQANDWDIHSISVNPLFVSDTNLHVNKADLDSAGIELPEITVDIDGESRGTPPDIGADEFTPSGTNAALVSLHYPQYPFPAGNYPVKAVLKNSGVGTLQNVEIKWNVNGDSQQDISWTGQLSTGEIDSIEIGNIDFIQATAYDIQVWIESINGSQDIDNTDDSLAVKDIYTELMEGTYSIGDSTSDFTNFNTLAEVLNKGGISGPLTFLIKEGIYEEQFVLNNFSGNDCETSIVFEAERDSSVILKHSNSSASNYIVYLKGVSGVTFKNLIFEATNNSYGRIFQIDGGSNCIHFENNKFKNSGSGTSTNQALIYSGSGTDNNITWINNYFEGGSYGVYLEGSSRETGIKVTDNTFNNQSYRGVYLYNQSSSEVNNNVFNSYGNRNDYIGVYLYYVYDSLTVTGNHIHSESGGNGIYEYVCYSGTGREGLIANNFISLGGTSTAYGITLSSSNYQKVYHNNVHIYSSHTSNGRAFYNSSGSNLIIKNNIFANTGGGYAIHTNNTNINSDYNDLYTEGEYLAYYSSARSTLVDWQAITNWDSHSISANPLYTSEKDLHVNKADLDSSGTFLEEITTDIDGELRNIPPDMGADEFTPSGTNGALVKLIYPELPFSAGSYPIKVVLKNSGVSSINSTNIQWNVRNEEQSAYSWTGLIENGESDTLTIGNVAFEHALAYDIKVWLETVNGVQDIDNADDTLAVEELYTELSSGTYSVGDSLSDFANLTSVANALNKGGISGPLTFNLKSGIYNEQVTFTDFPGNSCDTPVIFQPEKDSSEIIITHSNSSSNNYIINLKGVSGFIFKGLTFDATNYSYGITVNINEGASCNHFENNVFRGSKEGSRSSSNQSLVYSGSSLDNNNTWINNYFEGGSYGIYLSGSSAREQGTELVDNIFRYQSYRGLYLEYQNSALVKGNTITSSGSRTDYSAVYLYGCNDSTRVLNNQIYNKSGGNGIYEYVCYGTSGKEGLIANNFITIGGSSTAYGITHSSSTHQKVYHNNVHIISSHNDNGRAYVNSSGSNIELRNNILANSGGGYSVYTNNKNIDSDYNNLYSTGNVGFYSGNRTTLSDWQSATEYDLHSLSVDPTFFSDTNLHVLNVSLNGTGVPLSIIKEDIDRQKRDPLTPDIGADEFSSALSDVSLVAVTSPLAPFSSGENTVEVNLVNNANSVLSKVTVNWAVNGVQQPQHEWQGQLLPGEDKIISIGSFNFLADSVYNISAWTSQPNGAEDENPANDSTSTDSLYTALAGKYNIGGENHDFENFSEATLALKRGGVVGKVTFEINPGEYEEQISISVVKGASAENSITFIPAVNDTNSVRLQYTGSSTKNYLIEIDGADFLKFENLSFKAESNNYGRLIWLHNGASDITFKNNVLEGVKTTNSSNQYALIYSGNGLENNNQFINNTLINGSYGFYLEGESNTNPEKGLSIKNNLIKNQSYVGIRMQYNEAPVISDNIINAKGARNDYYGVQLLYCNNGFELINNQIISDNGNYGVYVSNSSAQSASNAELYNNFISLSGNSTVYGVYLINSSWIELYYNNVYLNSPQTGSAVLYAYSGSQIKLINNILANAGNGYALYARSNTAIQKSDFNNLYSNSGTLGYWSGNRSDIVLWKLASGQDDNSLSVDPLFYSAEDLHVRQALLNEAGTVLAEVTTDIDGEVRSTSRPDIGADEFIGIANDLSVVKLSEPTTSCDLGNDMPLTVTLQNYGSVDQTGFSIHYIINDTVVVEEIAETTTVEAGETLEYSFETKPDLSITGEYSFSVVIKSIGDENPLNDTLNKSITNYPPITTVLTSDTSVCKGNPITLSVTGGKYYAWSNGAGGSNVTVSPTEPTMYYVTTENALGCKKTDSVFVDIRSLPVKPEITLADSNVICKGDSVLLQTNLTTDILWSTGEITPSVYVKNPGSYSVATTSENGCEEGSDKVTISYFPAPEITVLPSNVICEGDSVYIEAAEAKSYNWSIGDTTKSLRVSPDEISTYVVQGIGKEGCNYKDSVTVNVVPLPVITFVSSDTTICKASSLILNVDGVATTYKWNTGQNGKQIQVNPQESATYSVTASNGSGCSVTDTASLSVQVLELPQIPVIDIQGSTELCTGDSVKLSSGNGEELRWSNGIKASEIYVATDAGITATVTDENGCSSTSESINVTTGNIPSIKVNGNKILCRGDSVELIVENGRNYSWSTEDTSKSLLVSPAETTIYTVVAENSLGCSYSDTVRIEVINPSAPAIVKDMLPADATLNLSNPVKLSWQPVENAGSYDVYIWKESEQQPSTPTISNTTQINVSKDKLTYGTNYLWRVSAKNSCNSTMGAIQTFQLRELPDLIVEDIQIPSVAYATSTLTLSWVIRNKGQGSTISKQWNDEVYLSNDSVLSYNDVKLGSKNRLNFLSQGQAYTQSETFDLPGRIFGDYYVIVSINGPVLEETNKDNNKSYAFPLHVTIPETPDLEVISIGAPEIAFGGDEITITYGIKNIGTAEAKGKKVTDRISGNLCPDLEYTEWTDALYISDVETFYIDDAEQLSSRKIALRKDRYTGERCYHPSNPAESDINNDWYNTPDYLSIDSVYYKSFKVKIPHTYNGTYYLAVLADKDKDIRNEIFTSNNKSESVAITVNLTPPPNLILTQVGAPSSGFSGQEIDINWSVKNVGANAPVENRWLDKYYISKSDTFNLAHATEIGYQVYTRGTSLSPDSGYSVNKSITLPHGISGQYYLYVVTDAAKQVFEHVYDDDNVLRSASPVEIFLSAFPDLSLQNVQIEPDVPNQGDTIKIEYEAANIGDTLVYKNWIDTYGLVTDTNSADYSTMLNRTQISRESFQVNNNAGLDSSASYKHSFNMALPIKLYGDHYLRVHLNSNNELYEHLHTQNNLINFPVNIEPVYSDLEITVNTELQENYFSGQQIVFNHAVKNIGDAFTDSEKWWDYIYLSTDPELQSGDLQIAKTQHTGILSAGKTYSSKLTANIPNGISGSYYLIFSTGVDFNSYRQIVKNPANDTIRSNNYKIVPVEISIPNTPDLVVDTVKTVEEAYPGERIEVNCTIKNQGASATKGSWTISTWISSSPVLQGQSYRMAGSRVSQTLAAGEEMSMNITAKIPGNITGNYYLIVEVDDYDNQFEYKGEENNLYHKTIQIKQPLPVDLLLSDVTIPSNIVPGEEVSVSYKIKNQGTGKALGSVRDIAYFSEDVLLEETLDEILKPTDYYISLAPGDSMQRSITYKMPGVLPGEYYGIARTNATQSMYEVDYENNIDVSLNTLQTDIPELTLGKPEKFDLDYRENKYFKVDLEANQDLLVDLKSNMETGTNHIYIAHNRVPTPDDYDYKYTEEGVPSHVVLVPETNEGTYYILVTTPDSYYGNQTMTITPEALPFSILDLKSNVLGQGIASNYVRGAGFREGVLFYLLKAGTEEIYAQATVKEFYSSMRLLLQWDLSNVPLGIYDVKAVNTNGEEVFKENAITVETKQSYEVVYGTDAPTSGIRQGNIGTWQFTFKSTSNVDIPYLKIGVFYPAEDPLVEFKTSENFFKLSDNLPEGENSSLSNFNTLEASTANDRGLGDLNVADLVARDVKPGEILTVQISVRASRYAVYPVSVMYITPLSSLEYIEQEVVLIEEIRKELLNQEVFNDNPDYFALVNDPIAFKDTLLNYNYIKTGLIDDKEFTAGFDFSPGNSPGAKDYPVIFFHKGGNYLWEINDVDGQAGSDPGWDLLTTDGTLTINSTPSEPFTVKLSSLKTDNSKGPVENWNPSLEQCWPIVIAQGGITGFNTSKFRIETSDFGRYNSFYGDFSLKMSEDTLLLCYSPGNDMDGDGVVNEEDGCPLDSAKTEPGICGCGVSDVLDSDNDGVVDCLDECPDDPDKTEPGVCGCGVADADSDNDGIMDCDDQCPGNPDKTEPGICGCGIPDTDSDGDGTPDCIDKCPSDPNKISSGTCGCGIPDTDSDNDGVADCDDNCPNDPNKISQGTCGCGVPDTDSDGDGTPNCLDPCPNDPNKTNPGICGCGVVDRDSDGDGVYDCQPDACPNDPNKNDPGVCGCGVPDTDSDGDGTPDCIDPCPNDPNKTNPGTCGCGVEDTDSDGDGVSDCNDNCPDDPDKMNPGTCGCGTPDTDSDGDGTPDCQDDCPDNSDKTSPGTCGCDEPDSDNDGDGVLDCEDECHFDPGKSEPGECGCLVPDTDSDGDGTADCNDNCPNDPNKTSPGTCGCGIPDTDSDGDGVPDCQDGCHTDPNKTEPGTCGCEEDDADSDGDGTPDCLDQCPGDPEKTSPGKCGCGVSGDDCELGCSWGMPFGPGLPGIPVPGCEWQAGGDMCCNVSTLICNVIKERFFNKKKTCLKLGLACGIRGGALGPWGAAGGALACYGLCVYAKASLPDISCTTISNLVCVPIFASCDPNEIAGPQGYGERNWTTGLERLPYTIYYENDPELATAPAQRVEIVQPIDSKLDPLSFRLKDFGFGDYSFEVPENVSNYTKTLDLSDSLGILLQVTAGIDVINNEAFWLFQSIDPVTGVPPLDPFSGFLPINDSLGSGQGFVNYTILPKTTTETGDSVTAQAEIIFDDNAPIETNVWMNTLDFNRPVSQITDLPGQTVDSTFTVSWEGEDEGSGIKYYNLFYSVNDGPFYQYSFQNAEGEAFATDSVYTSVMFEGKVGEKYAFYTQAADSVGNIEPEKTIANEITVGEFINTAPTFSINEDSISLSEDFTSVVTVVVDPDEVPDQDTSQTVTYSILPEDIDFVNVIIDSLTGEVSIIAKKDGYGTQTISIVANDGQKANATDTVRFKLHIAAVNDAPIVTGEISDKEYMEQEPFSWFVEPGLISDVDMEDTLQYTAFLKGENQLPEWLNFDADSLKFYGNAEDDGNFEIVLKAEDLSGETVETSFIIAVQDRSDIMDIHLSSNKTVACVTDELSFEVTLEHAGTNPTYKWLLNGEVIDGPDSTYYQSSSLQNGDQIAVIVSAGQDADIINPVDTSTIITLKIDEIPEASIQEDGLVLTANSAYAYQWYKDNTILDNTERTLIVENTGNYVVKVITEGGCSDVSDTIFVQVSGLNDGTLIDEAFIKVYPNPNVGEFEIVLTNGNYRSADVKILSVDGRLIRQMEFKSGQYNTIPVDISSEGAGLYLVIIQLDDRKYIQKIEKY